MHETRSDVYALRNSGFDAFLYADVGAEANGSTLTILSILARLGKDPWAEAARWAALPKAAVIDSLTRCIAEMPLAPSALASARDSAVRLVQLLPTKTQGFQQGSAAEPGTTTPKWAMITLLYFAFAVATALNLLLIQPPSSNVPAQIDQSKATPEATHPATRSLPPGAAVVGLPVIPDRR